MQYLAYGSSGLQRQISSLKLKTPPAVYIGRDSTNESCKNYQQQPQRILSAHQTQSENIQNEERQEAADIYSQPVIEDSQQSAQHIERNLLPFDNNN